MSAKDDAWDCRGDIHNDDDGAFFATFNTPNSGVDSCVLCTQTPGVTIPPPCQAAPHTNPRFNNSSLSPAVSARSFHPGGVQVALGDGSVRFAGETIALSVWRAIGSSQGRETDQLP